MTRTGLLTRLLLVSLALISARISIGQQSAPVDRWQGADGRYLPFETDEELLLFLENAKVVSQKELTGGINRPLKVRLEQDGLAANAIFRIVDVRHPRAKLDGKLVMDFHDSYIYECAAYELSRMLGIDNVPPCVKRTIDHTEGTMQLWIEGTITEKSRREDKRKPPMLIHWLRQKQSMLLLDALIYNFDRNQGNMLIDSNWKLWFIDHTRSFKKSSLVERMEKIIWCERDTWENLLALDRKQLSERLNPYLTSLQIKMTLKRRDKLVAYLRERIERMGEEAVLYEPSKPAEVSESDLAQFELDDEIPEESSRLEEPRNR